MEYKLLGSLVKRKIGYGIVQPGQSIKDGVPVIKVNNIINGLKSVKELETTTQLISEKYPRTLLHGGELIISVVGTIGKTAIVPKSFAGCNLVRAVALIDIADEITSKWVKYYLDSPYGKEYIHQNLNTTVQPTLNIKSLTDMPIPFYNRPYMEKSVSLLSGIDDKIALNNKINDNLERQAEALYCSLFVDFDYMGLFQNTKLGSLQDGWQLKSLSEVTSNIRTRVGSNTYKVLSALNTGCLQPSEDYFNKQVFSKNIKNYIVVEENDFAYNPSRINIGSIGMNSLGYVGCVSPVYVVVRPEKGYHYFLDFFIKSKQFTEEVKIRASGSVRQSLSYADFGQIKVWYPPIKIVEYFNARYEKLLRLIQHYKKENVMLAEIRNTLLPKLMNGEIEL